MTTTPTPPQLAPSLVDLTQRLTRLRASRRTPLSMGMSPETWARLIREDGGRGVISEAEDDRSFEGVPVTIYDECWGVAIAYSQG